MRILGIETSCDETAVAVVSGKGERMRLETSLVRSQIAIHEEYGGVVPEVAAREHLEVLLPMIRRVLPNGGEGIDAIAVTAGPGLAPALRVGVETAKALAYAWQKPLVSICHLEGHIYASWLGGGGRGPRAWLRSQLGSTPKFPALALIVSGGHTELVLMKDHGVFERLGETLDDAAGEAFDKVAKMLGLGYPGGPKLAQLAEQGNPQAFKFPRPLLDRDDCVFSFSGLKTSVLYFLRNHEQSPQSKLSFDYQQKLKADVAASFQEAVVDVLVERTMREATKHKPRSIILAGGVAANVALRGRLKTHCKEVKIPLFVPDFAYAMDNAAMIATAGYFRFQEGKTVDPLVLKIDPGMDIG